MDNEYDLRAGILECLTTVDVSGNWTSFGQEFNPPNPGIWLNNGGGIGLPLSDRDAEALIAVSHQVRSSKEECTVRKTWELSPTDFQITNPAFGPFLREIVKKVSAGLGVDATGKGVRAELCKLLLCDGEAHFESQEDSEKAPGVFATLIISLPTKHEGDGFRLTHGGETKVFDTATASSFDLSYLAWFSDVAYEVRETTSGHRLLLKYNIIHETLTTNELAAGSNKSLAKLRKLFTSWKSEIDDGDDEFVQFSYLLSQDRTSRDLSFNALIGNDLASVSLLRQICDEVGFSLFLADMKTSNKGYGSGEAENPSHQEMIEVEETITTLQKVVDLEGRVVAEELVTYEPEFLHDDDPFTDKEPDDRDYEEYEYDCYKLIYFYSSTVVIVMPKSSRIDFFLSPSTKPKFMEWIETCMAEFYQNPDDEEPRNDIRRVFEKAHRQIDQWRLQQARLPIDERKPNVTIPQETVERMITATIELDNMELFREVLDIWPARPSDEMVVKCSAMIVRHDGHNLLPCLRGFFPTNEAFSSRCGVLTSFKRGFNEEAERTLKAVEPYQNWINSEMRHATACTTFKTREDGVALAQICTSFPPSDILNDILPPIMRANSQYT